MNYFITAIGTDSGKTLVSAIFAEAMEADYWKPVQAGLPADSDVLRGLVSNPQTVIHPEAVRLKMAASPHAAAEAEGIDLKLSDFILPATGGKSLVIEGAGGCLVPLNTTESIIDLVPEFNARVVLVSNHYLGSINHTLLTAELLRQRGYPMVGIVFNGEPMRGTEGIILAKTGLPCLLRIDKHENIDKNVIKEYAGQLKKKLASFPGLQSERN